MIKNKITFALFVMVAMTIASSVTFAGSAKVVELTGTVKADKGGKTVDLKVGDTVEQGSVIKTGAASKCSIEWGKGHVVTVQALARLSVDSLSDTDGGKTNLNIQAGRVQFRAEKMKGDETFSISTPTAVAGVRGTFGEISFITIEPPPPIDIQPIDIQPIEPADLGGSSEIILLEGSLGIETDAGEVDLAGGFMLEIDDTGGIGEIEGIPEDVLDGVLGDAGGAITSKVSVEEVQSIKSNASSAREQAPPTPKTEKKEVKPAAEKKEEPKKEEPKKEEAKPAAEKKTEESKPAETKPAAEAPKTEAPKAETEAPKTEAPATEAPKVEAEAPAAETPAAPEADALAAPETEAPEVAAPEVDTPEVDAPEIEVDVPDVPEFDDSVLDVLDQITDTVTTYTEEISPK